MKKREKMGRKKEKGTRIDRKGGKNMEELKVEKMGENKI